MTFNIILTVHDNNVPVTGLNTNWVWATGTSGLVTNSNGEVPLYGVNAVDLPVNMTFVYDGRTFTKNLEYNLSLEGTTVYWNVNVAFSSSPPSSCALMAATQGTTLISCLPVIRAFRDRCLPRRIIKDYYTVSKFLSPKIKRIREVLKW